MRPVRRASTIARAGSPRRAGKRRRHQHPDHRRRGDVAAAQRTARQRRLGDREPGSGAKEERGDHQRRRGEHPGGVGADDVLDDAVEADPVGGDRGQAEADRAGDRDADPASACGRAAARGDARIGIEAREPLRRDRRGCRRSGRCRGSRAKRSPAPAGSGRVLRPLEDLLDLLGDARPGVALGGLQRGRAHLAAARWDRGRAPAAPRRGAAGRPAGRGRRRARSVTTSA